MVTIGPDILISDVTVIDVDAGVSKVTSLAISDGLILDCESVPDARIRVDGRGLYAIPGLIDMHVHATTDPTNRTRAVGPLGLPTARTLLAVSNLANALRAGVTSVRDLGAADESAYAIRASWSRSFFVGARPFVAGPVITARGGHGSWMGSESEASHEIPGLVRKNLAMGADVIKLMMRSAARRMELRLEELEAAVAEAHWVGVPVAVHANFSERSIDLAVEAGCDTLEHGFSISDGTAAEMKRKGIALCPTTVALRSIVDDPGRAAARSGSELVDAAITQLPLARASFQKALSAGVTLIAGTDAGVPGVGFEALPRELESMVEWGATHQQVLASATTNAARALGHPELGTLETGTPADIVLLRADPLATATAYREPVLVLQQGRVTLCCEAKRLSDPSVVVRPGTVMPAGNVPGCEAPGVSGDEIPRKNDQDVSRQTYISDD